MMVLQTIPLGHLGTAPHGKLYKKVKPTSAQNYAQIYAQRAPFSPIYTQSHFSILLIPDSRRV